MQLDPINPKLKAPGTKRLTLECDEPPSNFAFKFNLRRYTKVIVEVVPADASVAENLSAGGLTDADINKEIEDSGITVGRCTLPYQTHVESAWKHAVETTCAFNCCFQCQFAPLHHGVRLGRHGGCLVWRGHALALAAAVARRRGG